MDSIQSKIMSSEDLFPMSFTQYIERPYGYFFFDEKNKQSYDSNHALIYSNRIKELGTVLDEITRFYIDKGIHPSIYQAIDDEGFFESNGAIFKKHGYGYWKKEPANFMLLSDDNRIETSKTLSIQILNQWDEKIATDILIPSNEDYEINVIKATMVNPYSKVFVGYLKKKAVAITYFHIEENGCCRFDYIIVAPEQRSKGYARELLSYVSDFCRAEKIDNCFLWPAHKTSEKICYEAGFRSLFTSEVARASYNNEL